MARRLSAVLERGANDRPEVVASLRGFAAHYGGRDYTAADGQGSYGLPLEAVELAHRLESGSSEVFEALSVPGALLRRRRISGLGLVRFDVDQLVEVSDG